jgi:GrpB-like predicted nucleotidyltransferase (UPF0157 family)
MVIEEYDENWIKQFGQIKEILKKILSKVNNIEHVGSTAIMGMREKPIIDIIIEKTLFHEAWPTLKIERHSSKVCHFDTPRTRFLFLT